MKAVLANLSQFLKNRDTQFIIPVYQRNYDWTETQCIQLLKDIIEVSKNETLPSHFIGSIVYLQDSAYLVGSQLSLTIIDGQQRLTTVTLMILAIAHKLIEIGNEKRANQLINKYIINEDYEDEKLKLRPIKNDNKALHYLIKNDFTNSFDSYSRVIENYHFFKSEISINNIDTVLQGVNKLFFVEVSLERGKDEPQRIFESLNSTGLDLSQADLIRNYVLMDIESKEQTRIYESYWINIENNTIENKSKTSKLSDFIRDFITFKDRKIPPKNQVFQWFRKRHDFSGKNIHQRLQETELILKELKRFSIHYNKLINNDFETDSLIRKHLKYINRLEINVAYPFLLEVYDDYSQSIIDKTDFISILQLIQSFVWRRFICSLPTNALNKIFMTLYQNIDKQNYLNSLEFALIKKKGQQRFPNDKEIIDEISVKDFYNIQTKNRIYFLERLENFGKNIPFFIEGNEKVTTEHILPQNPTNEWKDALGSRFNHVFEKYLNTISNLTISGNNAELGRRPFKDKRDYPEFGYTASGLWLNQYLSTIDKWTEEEIIKRNKIICDRTLNIWQYPKNVSQSINNEDEINIFDLGDVTGKKIDYYIFFDSKYTKSNYSEILCFVAKTLFDMDANRFLQTELATTLRITTNKNNLRQSAKLGQTYYIDTHGNSNKTIKKIQKVLEAFELYDELFIKFNDKQNE